MTFHSIISTKSYHGPFHTFFYALSDAIIIFIHFSTHIEKFPTLLPTVWNTKKPWYHPTIIIMID